MQQAFCDGLSCSAKGAEIQVHTHDAINLPRRTDASGRLTYITEASAAHAAKMQAQVATMKSKLADPNKEFYGDLTLKARGSDKNKHQDASQLLINH